MISYFRIRFPFSNWCCDLHWPTVKSSRHQFKNPNRTLIIPAWLWRFWFSSPKWFYKCWYSKIMYCPYKNVHKITFFVFGWSFEAFLSIPFPLNVWYFFNFEIPIFDILKMWSFQFDNFCFQKTFESKINYFGRLADRFEKLLSHDVYQYNSPLSKFQELERWQKGSTDRFLMPYQ